METPCRTTPALRATPPYPRRGKIHNSFRKPIYVYAAARDVTEHKRAEATLRESEDTFRKLFEGSSDPILLLEGVRFVECNQAALKLLGAADKSRFIGSTPLDISPERQPDGRLSAVAAPEYIARAHREGNCRFEWLCQRYDGTPLLLDVSLMPITLRGESLLHITWRDITARKRAEDALRASETRFRDLSAMASDWFWEQDDQFRFTYFTTSVAMLALEQMEVGYTEMLGKTRWELPIDLTPVQWAAHRALLEAHQPFRDFEYRIRSKVGVGRWFNINGQPLFDDSGRFIGYRGTGRDITERKRAEAELQRHREHLEELAAERTAELRQAMAQLMQSEKLAALGSLVAGVAHELNTPLGNARVVASSLGEHLQDFAAAVESGSLRRSQVDAFLNRGREAVDLLERNAARAADLISHFKQVAVDQTSTRRRSFNLGQTVEEVLVTLGPQFKRTAHRIELEIPPELELDSYPGPLEQVIANLISNSLTHGFAGREAGCIRIEAAPLDVGRIRLRYGDDGAGIPETIRNRIFEPFFTTKLGGGGSGLGLYIVYNLVSSVLGGTVQVHSPPSLGVTFDLILPTVAPALPTPALRVS